jgi:hypothetical protein
MAMKMGERNNPRRRLARFGDLAGCALGALRFVGCVG